jgi:hypothetical protein
MGMASAVEPPFSFFLIRPWKGYELLKEEWMYYPSLAKNSQRLYIRSSFSQLADNELIKDYEPWQKTVVITMDEMSVYNCMRPYRSCDCFGWCSFFMALTALRCNIYLSAFSSVSLISSCTYIVSSGVREGELHLQRQALYDVLVE